MFTDQPLVASGKAVAYYVENGTLIAQPRNNLLSSK